MRVLISMHCTVHVKSKSDMHMDLGLYQYLYMSPHVYVYVRACMHACMHGFTCVCLHAGMSVCMCLVVFMVSTYKAWTDGCSDVCRCKNISRYSGTERQVYIAAYSACDVYTHIYTPN